MNKKVLCNPLNIDYKFQHVKSGHAAFREAADPTLILFKGRYYLSRQCQQVFGIVMTL